jgi:Matrixin
MYRIEMNPALRHVAVSVAFAATIAGFAPDARAFCRTVTMAPPAGWDESRGCFADFAMGAKALYWKNACVGYSLQQGASRLISLEQASGVVASAFQAWSSRDCGSGAPPSIVAVDQGPVECSEVRYNKDRPNQHVIVFRDDDWPYSNSSSTLGLTTVTYDTKTGEILGADMEINASHNLVVADPIPPGSYDLSSVVTHEVGHFFGLAHSNEAGAIMLAHYRAGAQVANDDVQGLCAIYPPDGTRATSDGSVMSTACNPTPRHGFSSQCDAGLSTSDGTEARSSCAMAGRTAATHRGVAGGTPLLLGLLLLFGRRGWRPAVCSSVSKVPPPLV